LEQFKKIFNRPDIIRNIYNDKPDELNNTLIKQNLLPPEIVFESIIADEKSNQVKLNLYASSSSTLNKLNLFVDGAINSVYPVTGDQGRFSFNLDISHGIHWITTLVEDKYGLESIPKSVMINFSQNNKLPSGNLYVLGVGINKYLHLNELKYAQKDVDKFIDTVLSVKSKQYSKIFTNKLYNDNATATAITSGLRQILNQSSASDTIFLYFAGHGEVDKTGNYYFLSSDTKANSIKRTALSLNSVIRILDQIDARKIVFIDTCHSGLISIDFNSNNKNLIQGNNIVIISASKSRQYSRGTWLVGDGHGLFSYYIIQGLDKQRNQVDSNENNIVELSELYRFVKQKVVNHTKGEQTPWLFNKMRGEVPLL